MTIRIPLLFVASLAVLGCDADKSEGPRQPPASAPAPSDRAEPPAPPRVATEVEASGPKVAFLGDSISAGLHLPSAEAFPAVLQRRLGEDGLSFQLLNAGVSGDTTAGGLRRIDWLLKQRPQIVVIELGGNDGLRGVPLATIEGNLRKIVGRVREAGATPLVLGMRLPPSYGEEYSSGFDAIYSRLAEQLDIAAVPFFMRGVAGVPELNLEDGLHPTPQGHERLADNVEPALRALLKEQAGAG